MYGRRVSSILVLQGYSTLDRWEYIREYSKGSIAVVHSNSNTVLDRYIYILVLLDGSRSNPG